MKELEEYRTNLMERLIRTAKEFRDECLAVHEPYAPIRKQGWNVHQIAVHTRDVHELVYASRARRTALEENPEFPNFDGEAYMAEHYDANESLSEVLDEFVGSVETLIQYVQTLSSQSWSRVSCHTTLGSGLTLQSWVERGLAHIEEHLEEVRKPRNLDV